MPNQLLPHVREGVEEMSVLIKGMEMPRNCWDCPLINTSPCACKGYSTALEHVTDRHADCPLVPVPKHGRLGDLDRLEKELVFDYAYAAADICRAAPTIIPAEEDE